LRVGCFVGFQLGQWDLNRTRPWCLLQWIQAALTRLL